ncbi:hypothetical protein [Amantichitinum ursilacus]|uniref:Uncharacterized protein n=1 Tax=Amantichitinum ursilacus TaxID=857265 RepID=A0A0N0XJQ6_9NEIS|nr:hypothetical protein [Amantichitinum ursilacus]KPC52526.1 hypothetical protein WG78_11795 [Amantichitinum ursilacus]
MRQKIVLVIWIDSFGCPAGCQFEHEAELAGVEIKGVGMLLRRTRRFIFLVPHPLDPGVKGRKQLAGRIAIPRRQITSSKDTYFFLSRGFAWSLGQNGTGQTSIRLSAGENMMWVANQMANVDREMIIRNGQRVPDQSEKTSYRPIGNWEQEEN